MTALPLNMTHLWLKLCLIIVAFFVSLGTANAQLAMGGTVTTTTNPIQNDYVHTFESLNTFTVPVDIEVEYLIVGGGGGGGEGGGGAGGMLTGTTTLTAGTPYTISVGLGGAGAGGNGVFTPQGSAENGGDSSLSGGVLTNLTAIGGGGGGFGAPQAGAAGGSGGGGSFDSPSVNRANGAANQGNSGGRSNRGSFGGGGGGGGAGTAGGDSREDARNIGVGGLGGNGLPSMITGTEIFYAGGGGGGTNHNRNGVSASASPGGLGGGGNGAVLNLGSGFDGTDGLGGGGGGADPGSGSAGNDGGNGGSGIVILRYAAPTVSILSIADGEEGGDDGVITVTLSYADSNDRTVNYSLAGSALSGDDYIALSGSVTILAFDTNATIDVMVIDDELTELIETVEITVTDVTGALANISSDDTAILNIIDNNIAELKLEADIIAYDTSGDGQYMLPGNDIIIELEISNIGTGSVSNDSVNIVYTIPEELIFYNADFDDSGPETDAILFMQTSAGLNFDISTDVAFSDSATRPSDFSLCTYNPISGYDANITHICVNPKGEMLSGNPFPKFVLKFRSRIN